MPITVHNVDATNDGFSTTPAQSLNFTGTSGRALVAIIDSYSGNTVTSVTDNQGNSYTELFATNSNTHKYFITANANGVTSVTPTFSGSSNPMCWFIEISGHDTVTPLQDSAAWASDGDGFVTAHGYEYTTVESGELVLCVARGGANRTYTGTNGATALQVAAPGPFSLMYEIISAAETADITWTVDTGTSCSAALISISPAASGNSNGAAAYYYSQL